MDAAARAQYFPSCRHLSLLSFRRRNSFIFARPATPSGFFHGIDDECLWHSDTLLLTLGGPPTRRDFASDAQPSFSIEKHSVLSPTLSIPASPLLRFPSLLLLVCTFFAVVVHP